MTLGAMSKLKPTISGCGLMSSLSVSWFHARGTFVPPSNPLDILVHVVAGFCHQHFNSKALQHLLGCDGLNVKGNFSAMVQIGSVGDTLLPF